jgi:hypothetical protein
MSSMEAYGSLNQIAHIYLNMSHKMWYLEK